MIDAFWFGMTAQESINESNAWMIDAKKTQWSPH
jgi:hypothetical protein